MISSSPGFPSNSSLKKRGWWQGVAARSMISTSALVLVVILATAVVSYNALRDMSVRVANQALEGQAIVLRNDLERRMDSLAISLAELSANPLIANALADDLGREVYLRDFIAGVSSAEGFKVTVVMTDFRGKLLASNRRDAVIHQPITWLASVVDAAEGAGRIVTVDGVPFLILVEPIIFRNTGTAEGALIFQVRLQDWLTFNVVNRAFDESPWLASLAIDALEHDTHEAIVSRGEERLDAPNVRLAPTMPNNVGGQAIGLHLTAKPVLVQEPLDALLKNVASMSGAIFILSLLGSFFLSRSQTRKLARLRGEAGLIRQFNVHDVSFTSSGRDEVDDLADTFTALVDELQGAYRQLEVHSQQEIERRDRDYQAIINNSAEGIITLSSAGIIETFNPSAERIFGHMADAMVGQNVSVLMPKGERTAHDKYLQNSKLYAPRIINRSRDLMGLRKDGSIFPLELNVSGMDVDGTQKYIGILRDISERKEFESRINAARVEAEQANLAKSQFLSSMSHELRTPLNGILGFSQILQMGVGGTLNDSQAESVGHILKSGEHLLGLIEQVLNLAKIESGNLTVSIDSIDVAPLMGHMIAMAEALAEKREITVKYDFPSDEEVFVRADNTRLQQVLLNLLSNAIKYNHQGGDVQVSCYGNGDVFRFEVKDTGPGIAIDKFDEVFSPFNRLGQESGEVEGTGIGLTITRELVKLMDGDIGFDSILGEGSKFWVDIPLVTGQDTQRLAVERAQGESLVSNTAPADRYKLLYVEDNPANIQLMEMVIKRNERVDMVTANSAEIGLTMAEAEVPTMILMDINLPGMSGLEAMKELKSNPATSAIPVIAVSANAMDHDVKSALASGFDHYLTKPLDIQKALKLISELLP